MQILPDQVPKRLKSILINNLQHLIKQHRVARVQLPQILLHMRAGIRDANKSNGHFIFNFVLLNKPHRTQLTCDVTVQL